MPDHRASAPLVDVRDLSIEIDGAAILSGLSFSVPAGASLAIIGPNGAGKTMLFRALLGAIEYTGSITWAPDVRIGYVPQKLDLERDVPITGRDFLTARAAINRAGDDDVLSVTRLVGLTSDTLLKRIGALSGGEFQRLLIAFALLGRPTVLLLDEPTAGVDAPGEERLNELVFRLQRERGLTVLLISHELAIVHAHATLVLCLSPNRTCFGPPALLTPDLLRDMYGDAVGVHVHAD